MTRHSIVTTVALLATGACSGVTCQQRERAAEDAVNSASLTSENEREEASAALQKSVGRWDGQTIRTNCLFPIDSFELPAWEQCHVAEAISSVGGLCLDSGGQRCMRPCRLDVGFVDRETLASQAHLAYDDHGRLTERMVDNPLAQGVDGSIDLVYRWYRDENGRLERLEEWIPHHPMVSSGDPVLSQWSLYKYDEQGRVRAIESYRSAQPTKSFEHSKAGSKSVISYRRDAKGRISERLIDGRSAGHVTYDDAAGGRLTVYENDVVKISYHYAEGSNRLERIEHHLHDGGVPENDLLTFGARHEIVALDFPRGSVTAGYRFEYDEMGRLVAELPTGPTDTTRRTIRWIYDCEESEP